MSGRQLHIRTRTGHKSFKYFLHEQQLTDKRTIDRIKKLGIPPAWSDVTISAAESSRLHAPGYDHAGRLQYVYSPKFKYHLAQVATFTLLDAAGSATPVELPGDQ